MRRLLAALLLVAAPAFAQENGWQEMKNGWGEIQTATGGSTVPTGCVATSVPIFLGSPVALGCDAGLTYDAVTDTLTSGRILAGDGSAAAPSVAFAASTTQGFYRAGPFSLGISTGLGIIGGLTVDGSYSVAWSSRGQLTSAAVKSITVGAAHSATPVLNSLLVGESGSGTDISGGGGVVASGAGTGAGAPSTLTFKTPAVHGSDAVAQTQATRLSLKEGHINIPGLVSYANNAAALVGGLVAGDLYTITGSDPLALAIVY